MKQSRMKLFDEVERIDQRPAYLTEPAYDYLNHSGREEFTQIREILEDWFSHYPASHKRELCGRFRSQETHNHYSAFFELFLHELLRKMNCEVNPHPDVGNKTDRKPDFHVKSAKGCEFYLEAVLAADESDEQSRVKEIKNSVYDDLNTMSSPDFFINIEESGCPNTKPSSEEIIAFLQEKLKKINYVKMVEIYDSKGFEGMPRWRYKHEDWIIDFFPVPKRQTRSKLGVRTIGSRFPKYATLVDDITRPRRNIVLKGERYGELGLPYVVAVNALSSSIDQTDTLNALFGSEVFEVGRSSAGLVETIKMKRLTNGALVNASGSRLEGVSAVLIAKCFLPENLPNMNEICLYHNPWSTLVYKCDLTRLRQAVPLTSGEMQFRDGENASTILGIV